MDASGFKDAFDATTDSALAWLGDNAAALFDAVRAALEGLYGGVFWLLQLVPFYAVALALAVLGAVVALAAGGLTEPGRGDRLDDPGSIASVARRGPLEEELEAEHVAPNPEAVLARDPAEMRVRDVFTYVLRVRSNRILIVVEFGFHTSHRMAQSQRFVLHHRRHIHQIRRPPDLGQHGLFAAFFQRALQDQVINEVGDHSVFLALTFTKLS